ncbi:MAG: tetratricopeptide repeat protein, partial [Verrucomicrobiae bacterium]|nr:tetratricopeptide repeat protein [Verrucomicrobiae bacterium]
RVTTQLGEKWTLQRLAREAGYSIEHLRRLCHLEVGRSPMHQVIYLRMRRAAELLTTTNEKIEAIAQAVGYQNQFTFSKAFHKWIGWQPSAYRSNRPNCPETTKSNQHLDKARTQIHHSLFTCALLFLCSALGEENRSLPIGNPEVNSPAAVRAGSMRSTPTTTPTTAQTEAAAEDRSLRSEQLRAAQELYQAFPHDPDVVYVTGYVFHEQGDYASAIRYWTEIAKPDAPKLRLYEKSDLLYNLGYTHLLREDYNQAIPLLQDSVRLNPRKPEAHYRLAHAFFLKGQFGETVRILDEANLKAPLAYRLRAMANQQLGKLSEAKHDYELALELNPELAEAYYGLAMVCARLGNKEEADEHRRKFEMLKSKADLAEREQRARFDPLAITRQSVARTHTELGRVHLLRGQILEAEKLFLRAAEIDTNNTACRFQLVMIYQQAHKNTEALRFAQEMVRAEPRNPFHHLAVGNLQARLGKHPEAEATFKKVIDLAPSNSEGYFALAQLYLQTNSRLPEALQLARRAVQLAPTPVNYYVLSRALASNGDRQTAIAAIEKACELDPTNPQLQNWKAYLQQTH